MRFYSCLGWLTSGTFQPLIWICIFTMIWIPIQSRGDVVTASSGRKEIVIPPDKAAVKLARFTLLSSERDAAAGKNKARTSASGATSSEEQQVLRVGPNRELKYPSDAAKIARDDYLIEIDTGVYHNDYAKWPQNNLIIKGVGGGMAHLQSTGLIPNGKAIWIIRGDNVRIEHIEFSGAAVENTNGAGIRHEGGRLSLVNTFFHDNEFSILSGKLPEADIEITSSRFWFQKRPQRHSHGIYVGQARRFTLTGSHIQGTDQGHQVKSRALENYILYNRIEDVPGGNSSRLVDLSNCGFSIVMGNDLLQASTTHNNNVIGYGPEGCSSRTEKQKQLYVINNTLINEATEGTLVNNHAEGEAVVANNLVFGKSRFLSGGGISSNNHRDALDKRLPGSWDPPEGSHAIDGGEALGPSDGLTLTPTGEFTPPVGFKRRPLYGELDAGSREKVTVRRELGATSNDPLSSREDNN